MTSPTDQSTHDGPLAGLTKGLTLAALGTAVVAYLLGFIAGPIAQTGGVTGALTLGGGLLAGAALLPRLSRLLAPAAVIAAVGALQTLLWLVAGPQSATVVTILVLLLVVIEAGVLIGVLLIRHGVIKSSGSGAPAAQPGTWPGAAYGQPAQQFQQQSQFAPNPYPASGATPYPANPYPQSPYPGPAYPAPQNQQQAQQGYQNPPAQYPAPGQYPAHAQQPDQYGAPQYGAPQYGQQQSAPAGWQGQGYAQSPGGYGGYPEQTGPPQPPGAQPAQQHTEAIERPPAETGADETSYTPSTQPGHQPEADPATPTRQLEAPSDADDRPGRSD